MGFHQHAGLYHASLLPARLCFVHWPIARPGDRCYNVFKSGYSRRTPSYWYSLRSLWANKGPRVPHTDVWHFVLCHLASREFLRGYCSLCSHQWRNPWCVLGGEHFPSFYILQSETDPLQTIGPLCVEVVGLQQLPSLLSLSWLTIVLPTFCACTALITSRS